MKRRLVALAALLVLAGEASAAVPLDDAQMDALNGALTGPSLSPIALPSGGGDWVGLPSDQPQTITLISLPIPGHVTAALNRLSFGVISSPW
jgi:hypothetical protein